MHKNKIINLYINILQRKAMVMTMLNIYIEAAFTSFIKEKKSEMVVKGHFSYLQSHTLPSKFLFYNNKNVSENKACSYIYNYIIHL